MFHKAASKCAKHVAIALIAISLTGCYLYPIEEEPIAPPLTQPQAIEYNTYTVALDTIERTITDSARFRAESAADCKLGSRGGYVAERNVRVGLEVKKDDILFALQTDDIDYEIKQARIAWEKAKFALEQAESKRNRVDIQYCQFDVDTAANYLNKLKDEKEKSIVRAPISGYVSWVSTDAEVGKWISANTVLCTIEDPSSLVLDYTGSKTSDFHVGMEVRVEYKREEYEGKVIMTPREAPEDAPERLKTTVRIDVPITSPKRGDDARITVVLDRREDVIVLPKNLVKNYMGQRFVQVLENNIRAQRDVEVGLETSAKIEIVNGLEVGELVIIQ